MKGNQIVVGKNANTLVIKIKSDDYNALENFTGFVTEVFEDIFDKDSKIVLKLSKKSERKFTK